MDGESRREQIIQILEKSDKPISGTELAKRLKVSRQIIVQDIALLRAVNRDILSTNKGYILYKSREKADNFKRIIRVCHDSEQIKEELYAIVDNGGSILDVIIEHDIYGQISVDLIISNRTDVDDFLRRLKNNKTRPLNELTHGVHYHTIVASKEEYLDRIEEQLENKGILLKAPM